MATVTDESVEVKVGAGGFLKFSGKTREQNLLDDSAELNKNIQQLNVFDIIKRGGV